MRMRLYFNQLLDFKGSKIEYNNLDRSFSFTIPSTYEPELLDLGRDVVIRTTEGELVGEIIANEVNYLGIEDGVDMFEAIVKCNALRDW